MESERTFDLVLFGATGFTGRLVAAVLRDRAEGAGVRWAIGGRSREKLERLRSDLGRPSLSIVVGDALDRGDMHTIAEATRVVCSTAGPYARYGSELVAACAEAGTHYCDLSGEVPWMRRMIEAHDETARRTGARIVPACGFDSIPSDIGVFLLQEQTRERFGRPAARIHGGLVRISGGMSGGTAQSALDLFERSGDGASALEAGREPGALVPGVDANPSRAPERLHPHWDSLARSWTAPWPMSLVNARVVYRSAALLPDVYGPDFRYEESMWTEAGPIGALKAAGVSLALLAAAGGLALPPLRGVAERVLPKPGEGPSERARARGFWEMRFVAAAPTGSDEMGADETGADATDAGDAGAGATLRLTISADEDPGYGSTSKMLVECALALVDTPAGAEGGLSTPAAAFGHDLVRRLRTQAGIRFDGV